MGLTSIPTRTDDSIGRTKTNRTTPTDFGKDTRGEEWNALADAVIALHEAVGLEDGSTPGSLVAAMAETVQDTPPVGVSTLVGDPSLFPWEDLDAAADVVRMQAPDDVVDPSGYAGLIRIVAPPVGASRTIRLEAYKPGSYAPATLVQMYVYLVDVSEVASGTASGVFGSPLTFALPLIQDAGTALVRIYTTATGVFGVAVEFLNPDPLATAANLLAQTANENADDANAAVLALGLAKLSGAAEQLADLASPVPTSGASIRRAVAGTSYTLPDVFAEVLYGGTAYNTTRSWVFVFDGGGSVTFNGAPNNVTVNGSVGDSFTVTEKCLIHVIATKNGMTDPEIQWYFRASPLFGAAITNASFSGAQTGRMRRTGASAYAVVKDNIAASAAPTTGDNFAAGYAISSEWIDTTNKHTYACIGDGQWIRTDRNGVLYSASRDPLPTDNVAAGYKVGEEWENTSGSRFWKHVADGKWLCVSDPGLLFRWNETDTTQLGSIIGIGTVGGTVVPSVVTSAAEKILRVTGTDAAATQVLPFALSAARTRRVRVEFTQHQAAPGAGGLHCALVASDGSCAISYYNEGFSDKHQLYQIHAAGATPADFSALTPAWNTSPMRYVIDFDVPVGALATGDVIAARIAITSDSGTGTIQFKRTTVLSALNGKTFTQIAIGTGEGPAPTTADKLFDFSDVAVRNLG